MAKHDRARIEKQKRNREYALRFKQKICKDCGHVSSLRGRCKMCGSEKRRFRYRWR